MHVWMTATIAVLCSLTVAFLLIWTTFKLKCHHGKFKPSIWIQHKPFPSVELTTCTVRQTLDQRSRSEGEVYRISPLQHPTPMTLSDLDICDTNTTPSATLVPLIVNPPDENVTKARALSDPCVSSKVGDADAGHSSAGTENSGPLVRFGILLHSVTETLLVNITGITLYGDDLKRGVRGLAVEVTLVEDVMDHDVGAHGHGHSHGHHRRFQESGRNTTFSFPEMTMQKMNKFSLRVEVFGRRFAAGLRGDRLLGAGIVPLARIRLVPDIEVAVVERLPSHRNKNTKCKDGRLQITLQYQVSSNRMKVVVCKGQDLPVRQSTEAVKEEFYVLVHSVKGSQVEASKRTRSEKGPKPIWNQTFLFDMRLHTLHRYSLRLIVISSIGGPGPCDPSNDHVVGQVVIGPEANSEGQTHWQDVLRPMAIETVQWHRVEYISGMKPK